MTLSVRPAVPADAPIAVRLIHTSMVRLADFLFGANSATKAQNVFAQLFARPRNRFSHQFADIAVVDDEIVGLLLSYAGKTMKHLEIRMGGQMMTIYGVGGFTRFLRRSLPLIFINEARANEYFINTVAVLPEFRGRGIGTRLLMYAEEKARAASLRTCALSVEIGNTRARRLYERLGYQVVETVELDRLERRIGYKGFRHMVKVIA